MARWSNRRLLQQIRLQQLEILLLQRRILAKMETDEMATTQALARMQAAVSVNTDRVKSAADALTHFAQTNADLTAQLQAALAGDDEEAVKAAADALEANNKELLAAVPATATAVAANT